jgi:hypothetical protein
MLRRWSRVVVNSWSQFTEHGEPRLPHVQQPNPAHIPVVEQIAPRRRLEDVLSADLARADDDLDRADISSELAWRCERAYAGVHALRDCVSSEALTMLTALVRQRYGRLTHA